MSDCSGCDQGVSKVPNGTGGFNHVWSEGIAGGQFTCTGAEVSEPKRISHEQAIRATATEWLPDLRKEHREILIRYVSQQSDRENRVEKLIDMCLQTEIDYIKAHEMARQLREEVEGCG